jgi:CheY-like chemotaxis protein
LRQVFANLVSNAIACTGDGGRVVVKVRQHAGVVEVAVTDTGRGIDPEFLPHLFQPFRQEFDTGNGGLGLGLAVAHQLVMLHHGTIVAASAGVGQGATFTVGLPIAASVRPHEARPRPPAQLAGVHVLVVDDDPRVLDAIQIILTGAGALVDTARSADAGCGAFERSTPDVVLSDLAMPDGDGCSMMRRIRAREAANQRIPAVAMTAHVADTNRRDALAAGFDRYLTKPLDIDQLISTLAGLVHVR